MDNKLRAAEPQFLQSGTTPTTVNLPGDNNTLIAHADQVTNEYRSLYVINNQPNGNITAGAVQEFNPDYYNLMVVGDGDLDGTGHFLVDKRRAITESTSQELKDAYASLTPEAIEEIKTFPAIIATENHSYGKTDDQHQAIYGIITDVKKQDNGIKVYYQVLNWIPQQRLNDLAMELGLGRTTSFNELNRMHWAIKRINMVEVLREAGIKVFSI
jgi:hypothetical protein